jgi:dolichyl-phosphate-mannose--protein O-mannosyl transferase
VPQVACMSALSGLVAVYLVDNSYEPTTCLLNLDGDVCTFTYVTTMITLLIALGILFGFLLVDYTLVKPLQDVVVGSSLFLAFWQFVMALTIQIRGDQATDAGYPRTSARQGAYAMAWISTSSSLIMAGVTIVLMWRQRPKSKKRSKMAVPNEDPTVLMSH